MNQQFLQTKDGQKLQVRFLELQEKLSALEWITHGSVTPNHPGNWKWTTKVKAKTVTLSLTQEQADLFKEAIAANREAESILKEMRSIILVLFQVEANNPRPCGDAFHSSCV